MALRWTGLGALCLALLAGTAFAQAPERSPLPQPRPVATTPAPTATAPQTEPFAAPGTIAGMNIDPTGALRRSPVPVPRPEFDSVQLPESMVPARPELPVSETAQSTAEPPAETEAAAEAGAEIAQINPLAVAHSPYPRRRSADAYARYTRAAQRTQTGPTRVAAGGSGGQVSGGLCGVSTLEGRRLSRITSNVRGCGVAEPVSVTSVAGIRLSQAATLDCDTARAFDRWVRQEMQPAIGNRGGGVAQIRVAAHYVCRTRNHRPGARVSEHGRGRAIDIAGFRLANGQTVMVLSDWHRGAFSQALRQMHANACGIFRTTLGPGSDGHHEDHFHFDMAQRRNNSTYCR